MSTARVNVIGVDFATVEQKRGLATGIFENGRVSLRNIHPCDATQTSKTHVNDFIRLNAGPTLIAIDAPLGWPLKMGLLLPTHRAGDLIACDPMEFFRRDTDKWIAKRLGKTPLDVGADRIAKTALKALYFLNSLDAQLVWDSRWDCKLAAIEVYPAATLKSRGISPRGYKRPDQVQARKKIIAALSEHMDLGAGTTLPEKNADALDAVVCLLAAEDFLNGQAFKPSPEQRPMAEKEGWIWCRPPKTMPQGNPQPTACR